ncbi:MAG: OmpA family protein [Firmicutes bacterium]|nr:OmpA family protein [Bacillota bacterium]
MRKRRVAHKEGNSERWLITYSDLITLLLIFFVIMYAMSNISVAKFMTLSESLNSALDPSNQIPLNGLGVTALLASQNPTAGDQQGLSAKANAHDQMVQLRSNLQEDQLFTSLTARLRRYVTQHGLQNSVSVNNDEQGVEITLHDIVFFNTGQDTLRSRAQSVLSGLAPFLRRLPNDISVEGYTDNVPIHTAQFPSNWQLSVGRAVSVVEYLIGQGVNPAQLSATGYSKYRPLYTNTTHYGREMNRRVNIIIVRNYVEYALQAPYTPTAKGKSANATALSNIDPSLKINKGALITTKGAGSTPSTNTSQGATQ